MDAVGECATELMAKKLLIQNQMTWHDFNYQQGEVKMEFRVRIDIKSQLRDLKDILEKMSEDVRKELERKLD